MNSTENISTAPSETARKIKIREHQNLLQRVKEMEMKIKGRKREIEKARTMN